ncbi:MAG: hypothetical protein P8017_05645 [Deltaproteobacteria bacterium]
MVTRIDDRAGVPDRFSFADWIDMGMKEKSAKGLGKEGMNDAQLTKAL